MSDTPQWFHDARDHLRRELGRVPSNVGELGAMVKKKRKAKKRRVKR